MRVQNGPGAETSSRRREELDHDSGRIPLIDTTTNGSAR